MKHIRSLFLPLINLFSRDRSFILSLSRILGFYPANIALYKLAFRHKSFESGSALGKATTNNERLEYLGDAVVNTVVADYLFRKFPYKDEGFLTEMRSKIVSREHLNKLAAKLQLEVFMQENMDNRSKSIYGDAFEALVGAVYLDKGYDGAHDFLVNRIIKYHIDIEKLETTEINFKGKLFDWCQKEKKEIKFEVVDELGEGRNKKYKIEVQIEGKPMGTAIDFSKKKAEKRAAELALVALQLIES